MGYKERGEKHSNNKTENVYVEGAKSRIIGVAEIIKMFAIFIIKADVIEVQE